MTDNDLFSTAPNHSSFDNEGLEILPLITKERTQKFELLLHLIPNLKQHLIVSGASGIGKTLLLDMLYDIDNEAWQCCFIQGSAELSFEMIEAQLTKTLLRHKHKSLNQAFHDFQEQHKKIVLIIDDAGLLVSGLITTLIDYASGQPALKLIFALTSEARQNHRKTDKALDGCYVLEIPTLSKRQCAYFLRHLAAKPRTYSTLQNMDAKLLDKIYQETQGIPARLISHFTKISREKPNDYTKWLLAFVGFIILAMTINQAVRYFKESPIDDAPLIVEKIAAPTEKNRPVTTAEPLIKNDSDIVPEFKLDIEKIPAPAPANSAVATEEMTVPPVEKTPEPSQIIAAEPEKIVTPIEPIPEPAVAPSIEPAPVVLPPPSVKETIKPVAPVIATPPAIVEPVAPVIAFPKVEPATGMKIQALPDNKPTIELTPIAAPEVKEVKVEPVKKVEIKPVEKPAEVKKVEPVKKIEPKELKPVKEKAEKEKAEKEKVVPPTAGNYALQLITLSSSAAIENFQKKHPALNKNFHVVKSGSEGQERFALMYGGFANADEAEKARQTLPPEFMNALPRKLSSNP